MIEKATIVDAVNERLSATTAGRHQFDKMEHEAPVFHAIVGTIVDAVNAELSKFEERLQKLEGRYSAISKCGNPDCAGCKADR